MTHRNTECIPAENFMPSSIIYSALVLLSTALLFISLGLNACESAAYHREPQIIKDSILRSCQHGSRVCWEDSILMFVLSVAGSINCLKL